MLAGLPYMVITGIHSLFHHFLLSELGMEFRQSGGFEHDDLAILQALGKLTKSPIVGSSINDRGCDPPLHGDGD
ncbi:hypothetical protein Xmir_01630 [Xenorhabdus miraniensis]|uniref:Uncharacterized protein n=1 Tax=Xenorhabdus miraniensis TaxID=351674 RepID=A0A2D0JSK0_9GAMM|nr:hypothetical protein Xmir_01630 [Xenorhabdus miraniensis]